jgi:hypothetical protein
VREEPIVELTLLTVLAYPNAAAVEDGLGPCWPVALASSFIAARSATDARGPGRHARLADLLINGVDPFALSGQAPSLWCRLYRDAAGHLAPAP